MFSGSYELSVDEKGRIAVPARYRQELGETCGSQLVVTQGPRQCLEIYPAPVFVERANAISAMENREQAEILMDWFIGLAVESEVDKQGRLLLPPLLRRRVGLNGSAVLVGKITRFDLWPAETWNEAFDPASAQRTAERVAAFRDFKR